MPQAFRTISYTRWQATLVYTKITKRIDSFKETERKAYTKARDRAEEKYKELDERIKELEKSDREKKISDEKLRREVEELKTPRIQTRVRRHSNGIPFERISINRF